MDADWRLWSLLEPLVWEADYLGSGKVVRVPAGFITDGASVPRVLWALLPPTGSYMRAAALHDYLLWRLKRGEPNSHVPTRREADRQFHLAMLAIGVNRLVAFVMWAGVRLIGMFKR